MQITPVTASSTRLPRLSAGETQAEASAASSPTLREAPLRAALLEIVLFIGAVLALDAVWGTGDRFTHVEPHPFWAIVLLMAVHYGTREALIATGASSLALLVGNLPPQSLEQDIHAYSVHLLIRPLLWMVTSLVLGELRVRQNRQHKDALEHLNAAERRVGLLARAHKDLTAANQRMETRLAGQLRTATGLFEAARSLETLEPAKVIAGAIELVSMALHAKAFSLFLLDGDALVLAAEQGSARKQPLVDRYGAATPLFQAIVGRQSTISVATPAGEAALMGHGLIAGPLIDPSSGKLVGMLKVEEMAFLDLNVSSLQTFKTMCDWIAAAYSNAVAHKAAQIEDEVTRLYGMTYLDRQAEYVSELARRFGFDLTLLLFRVEVEHLSDEQRREIPQALGDIARKVLRRTDMVFSHEPFGTQFAVLLPGAPPENVSAVAVKLQEGLSERCGYQVPCTTQVRGLCRARDTQARAHLRADIVVEQDMVA